MDESNNPVWWLCVFCSERGHRQRHQRSERRCAPRPVGPVPPVRLQIPQSVSVTASADNHKH
ncbi:hypothetical protein JOB18_026913 [Solea senegalensis]|uniref:Uncharacterized protein n=1 Tax=Solea senegalensis TaxID=28829 RepID=A0AAV6PDL0_SOLSE|nr:hypothetical protein JOB18_026913 [Solea senegalensis]